MTDDEATKVVLQAGDVAPDFELSDADGKTWRLSDLRGKKVIVYFYPIDDTRGCTVQACDFRDSQAALSSAGYLVLGISPQDEDSHRRFTEKYRLNFPLLVDEGSEVGLRYGVADSHGALPTRSTFVIDEDGRLTSAQYGVRAKEHVQGLRAWLGV